MLIDIEKIITAKHIVLITSNDSFCNANALYSYMLTLHKKVSLCSVTEIDKKFSFLPWFDKVRKMQPSSAELIVDVDFEIVEFFTFLKNQKIKINQKMATSLYAGLLIRYNGFTNSESNGMVFALASELIGLKADYKLSNEFLIKRVSLATFRLKSILFKSMLLIDGGTKVNLYISENDLKVSGANIEDAQSIMTEVLNLVNVREVTLIKSDENSKILKILKEI